MVLDEADRMLDMGFFKDVTGIIEKMKNRTNMGLFSATISQEVMTVSWMYQRDEVEITIQPKEESRPDIDQFAITCNGIEKLMTTLQLLDTQGFELHNVPSPFISVDYMGLPAMSSRTSSISGPR